MKISVYLLSTVSSLAVAGAVSAADLPVKPQAQALAIPTASWTGFYIGVNGGAGRLNASQNHFSRDGVCADEAQFSCTLNASGGIFGLQGGYNIQVRNFLYGIEGDYDWTGLSNTQNGNVNAATSVIRAKVAGLGSIRGRMGLAVDDTLVYATGGVAFADVKSGWGGGYNGTPNTCCNVTSGSRTGWTAGLGVEHMLTPNWTMRLEVLYYDFGTKNVNPTVGGTLSPTSFSEEVFVGRVGLNLKW